MIDPDDTEIRNIWRDLVDRQLPNTAKRRPDWPVHLNHCFARILLDNAAGVMWREVIEPPAWRNSPAEILQRAVDLGRAVLADEADLWALNNVSLKLRGKASVQRPNIKKTDRRP